MQFDPKMVEAVEWALAVHFSGDRMPHMSGDPRNRLSPGRRRAMEDARDSVLEALCAHLNLPPEALNALAKGEAVVVPKVATRAMIEATGYSEGKRYELTGAFYIMVAASPYAAPPKGGGDE